MTANTYDTSGSTDLKMFSSLNLKSSEQYNYIVVAASTAASETVSQLAARFNNTTPAVKTEIDYLYDTNYVNSTRSILGMVSEQRVINPSNSAAVSKTQMRYDEYSLISSDALPTFATATWTDLQTTYHGNATSAINYTDAANTQYIETHGYFDQYCNPKKTVDGNGNESLMSYSTDYACAYPTETSSPVPDVNGIYGSNAALVTTTVYDFNTGLPTKGTDANGLETRMEYADLLLRPTKVSNYYINQAVGAETITEYGAPDSSTGQLSSSQRFVKVKTQIDAVNWKQGYTWFDGLGRTIKTQAVDSGGDVFAETQYDDLGRIRKATNPYRTGETAQWMTKTYDAFGRIWKVTTPDNSFVETTYGLSTTSGSQIGTAVTVTDQAGKMRRSITNALGQLTRVDEPNASNQLGGMDSPNQATLYDYDKLNNLTTVTRGSQTRSFVYDSVSRLKQATNPESGTMSYTYDASGNLQTKRDARGIKTIYDYDAFNRVIKRCYRNIGTSGSLGATACANAGSETAESNTPDVNYYDNLTNAKGKLIKISSSVSTTEYTSFDTMGRVTAHKQTTDGNAYTTAYAYNLSGALLEETYPSTRVVKNVLDADGDLAKVQSKKTTNTPLWNYAQNFTYTSAGAVSSMQLGNGRWESTAFNNRLQPTQIALGTSQGTTDLLKLDYNYGTTANNGNVLSQTTTLPTIGSATGFTAVQTYTYDSLNRIHDAKEMIGTTETWKQTFTYDRYGNRNFDEADTTTLPKNCSGQVCAADVPLVNPSINTTTNKNQLNGYVYDNSGNTIKDAQSRKFTYDAENKQTKVENVDSNGNPISTVGEYFYDGDGKRVKKIAGTEVTIFVYDAAGKLAAEYSNQTNSNSQVSYLTNDTLGTPRINTDKNGNVISRHDYQPFGEEIATSQRIQGLSYNSDEIMQKFTSYERDSESDLDFAKARMYEYSHGRFTSPDDFLSDTYTSNPQSWNLYVYVRNNPLNLTDPSGKKADIDTEINRKTKVITITVTTSIGLWSKDKKIKSNLTGQVKTNIENQIKKWAGSQQLAGGYTLNVNVNVTVKTFSGANSSDDVLNQDKSIQNVIQLTNGPATAECGAGANSCVGDNSDKATINNPDGTLPDVATWNYNSASKDNEPAHEFGHLLGIQGHTPEEMQGGAGYNPNRFLSTWSSATSASLYDYTRAFSTDVNRAIRAANFMDWNDTHPYRGSIGNPNKATFAIQRRTPTSYGGLNSPE
ncbi:MAG TPA: RHS repeat-associated core domain-containing protein [Pyrinomonadaceae bacterium]|jgi:RHS repeat-associated protein